MKENILWVLGLTQMTTAAINAFVFRHITKKTHEVDMWIKNEKQNI